MQQMLIINLEALAIAGAHGLDALQVHAHALVHERGEETAELGRHLLHHRVRLERITRHARAARQRLVHQRVHIDGRVAHGGLLGCAASLPPRAVRVLRVRSVRPAK